MLAHLHRASRRSQVAFAGWPRLQVEPATPALPQSATTASTALLPLSLAARQATSAMAGVLSLKPAVALNRP